jgi:hypothetical protein
MDLAELAIFEMLPRVLEDSDSSSDHETPTPRPGTEHTRENSPIYQTVRKPAVGWEFRDLMRNLSLGVLPLARVRW